jgi:hypothetical protein
MEIGDDSVYEGGKGGGKGRVESSKLKVERDRITQRRRVR